MKAIGPSPRHTMRVYVSGFPETEVNTTNECSSIVYLSLRARIQV